MHRVLLTRLCSQKSLNPHGTSSGFILGFLIRTGSNSGALCSMLRFSTECISSEDENINLNPEVKEKIFNTKLWETDPSATYRRRKYTLMKIKNKERFDTIKQGVEPKLPISLKYFTDIHLNQPEESQEKIEVKEKNEDVSDVNFPYSNPNETPVSSNTTDNLVENDKNSTVNKTKNEILNWMRDLQYYKDDNKLSRDSMFGTSDPKLPASDIPCGGCGSPLHCKDHAIPGYIPSEIFSGRTQRELRGLVCQRCHFLKIYNIALDVRVHPDEYPKILSQIKDKRALIVLILDLLDFPCSIWPGIMDIIGNQRPVVIVGNKVDLIPGDQMRYLDHIRQVLISEAEKLGISRANIKHTALISAETGYGVEDLITKLHGLWNYRSDVYIMGCTNVGKSTLFNTLLQSDFCKVQASDRVKRATTSVWPGTTLNLLKFPIMRPEGWKQEARYKRLNAKNYQLKMENSLKDNQLKRRLLYRLPLADWVGQTFYTEPEPTLDMFNMSLAKNARKEETETGINEKAKEFARGRWCFDTPGVVHPDQILDLLTTEELYKMLPRNTISPRYFTLLPGKSILLAGLGRIDYLEGASSLSIRFTVFSSEHLPVTVAKTEDMDDVYQELLGTEFTAVPCGGSERLSKWPGLSPKEDIIKVTGIAWNCSCADIVLSSAGWMSVTCGKDMEVALRAWTPHARGIYVRQCILPYAVSFKGKRVEGTPIYKTKTEDDPEP